MPVRGVPAREASLCSVLVVVLGACGPAKAPRPFAVRATAGAYSDGSGRVGLAVLATVRDVHGAGPSQPWPAELDDASGTVVSGFAYDASGSSSIAAWWFPDVPGSPGATYTLRLEDPERAEALLTPLTVPSDAPLDPAQVDLVANGDALSWPALSTAATYRCRVLAGGNIQLDGSSATPSCDVSALPPGAYAATITALSADPSAFAAADASQTPALPPTFQVSEATLAFARPTPGASAIAFHAVGGALQYGPATQALAVFLEIADATPRNWTLSINGPGIPAATPLTGTYAAVARMLLWSYDVPASPGAYSATASSGSLALSTRFEVGPPPALDTATGISVVPSNSGAADVSWAAVASARSYYASAWDHASGAFVNGQWTTSLSLRFASGTFTSGRAYDVYVAASDVDMTSTSTDPAQLPAQVSVSENTYLPVAFTAP